MCALALSALAAGQSNYAAVSGTVKDSQSLPVVHATVNFKALSTGATRSVTTNDAGIFYAPALLPDDYEVTTTASGFAPVMQSVHVEVGQKLALDVALKIGAVREGVEVSATPEILHTTDAAVGEVVEPKSIQELPLNGRMLIDLVLTVPGAHVGFGAQTGQTNPLYWRPGQRSAVVIGGARPNANFFLLDGATNTDPTFNTQNLSPSPDSVMEFQVVTSSYTADMGGAGGGQINIVTRSGTSQYHGTVYEFLRNGALDASPFQSMGNNHLVQNNFGASFGGPLLGKDKRTFFFLNYEGFRLSQADAQILTVPTPDEIMGDFSMSPMNIYDPTTAVANPSYNPSLPTGPSNYPYTRSQFPNNQIPSDRINQNLEAFLMQYVPQPNMMMMSMGADSNNYLDIRNETHVQDQGTVRIDHDFSNNDTAMARYSLGSENGFSPSNGSTATTENLPGFGANFDNLSQQAVISWNHAFSSNKLNTASLALSRLSMNHTSQNNGVNDIVGQLGIQGIGFGGQGAWGAPWFAAQGYTGIGDTFAATPMHAWDTTIELRDTFAWQHGHHALRFGGDARRYIWPMWGFFQNRGYYQFTNGYTTQFGFNDGSGSGLASLLLSSALCETAPGWRAADESPQLGIRWLRRRQLANHSEHDDQFRRSLRVHQPALRSRARPTATWSSTMACPRSSSAARTVIRPDSCTPTSTTSRPASESPRTCRASAWSFAEATESSTPRSIRIPGATSATTFPTSSPKPNKPTTSPRLHRCTRTTLNFGTPVLGIGHFAGYDRQLHRLRSARAGPVHPAVERADRKDSRAATPRSKSDTSARAASTCSAHT